MKYLKKSLFPVSLCFSILGLLVWLSADFASTVSTETTEAGFNSMFSLYIFSIVMSCISAALSIALVVFKTMETIQTSECRCKLIRKILRASGVLLLSIALILFVSGEYVHTHYLMDAWKWASAGGAGPTPEINHSLANLLAAFTVVFGTLSLASFIGWTTLKIMHCNSTCKTVAQK